MIKTPEFRWKVASGGYAVAMADPRSCIWQEEEEDDGLQIRVARELKRAEWPRDVRQGENLVPILIPSDPAPRRDYEPFREQPGLFRRFADLDGSEEALIGFVDRFGLPRADVRVLPPWHTAKSYDYLGDESDRGLVDGMELQTVHSLVLALRRAVNLTEAVASGDLEQISELVITVSPSDPADVILRRPNPTATQIGPMEIAREALDWVITTGLRLRCRTEMRGGKMQMLPAHLLGAMWIQAAAAVEEGKGFRKCLARNCPTVWFEVSTGLQGVRADAEFCSARCRHTAYRDRKKAARELHRTGATVSRIADKLNTDPERIKAWVGTRGR